MEQNAKRWYMRVVRAVENGCKGGIKINGTLSKWFKHCTKLALGFVMSPQLSLSHLEINV